MIPRLLPDSRRDLVLERYLSDVRDAGFVGDVDVSDAAQVVFATDNSIYEIAPRAVLFPRSADDVACALAVLAKDGFDGLSLTARGGGTGTNGQALNAGIVLDLSRHMNRILEINPIEGWARVQAGVVKDQLNAALAPHGMFFAPELSTSNRATIGGMINTDASGQGSCLYGKTHDHVLELTSVFSDGTLWTSHALDEVQLAHAKASPSILGRIHHAIDRLQRDNADAIRDGFPTLNRCLTGYDLAHVRQPDGRFNLNSLLCGSEGTLAVVCEAKIGILPVPKQTALVNIRYEDFNAGLRDARSLLAFGAASIETVDSKVLALAQEDMVWEEVAEFFPTDDGLPARGVNLVEFVGASEHEIDEAVRRLTFALDTEGKSGGRLGYTVALGEAAVQSVWTMRKRAVGLLGNMKGDRRPIPFVEDTAVPPENLADYIEEFRALLDSRGLEYGMFGHVDAGVLHVRPAMDMKEPGQERLIREITDAVADLTLKYGGLLWGEHGKGVRSEYSPKFFGSLYPLIQSVKTTFDPRNQLNPGKIAGPAEGALLKIDGVPMRGERDRAIPKQIRGSYADVINCNGNGACYDWDPDTSMCPSWKATRERRHSPKGRAMLTKQWLRRLAEAGFDPLAGARRLRTRKSWTTLPAKLINSLLHGSPAHDLSHSVKESMDGCLACKSCVGGCPIKVDVPGFRARFLELYHSRYLRPPKDTVVGMLERTLPLMAAVPSLTNAALTNRASAAIMRRLGLVDLPRLTAVNLKREVRLRGYDFATPDLLDAIPKHEREKSVVLVQDAFTSFYETGLVLDTLELISRLGFRPLLAPFLPNGKPLHVHGYLGAFERTARANAKRLSEISGRGFPLVGIDPSMTLTFRSEYRGVLPSELVPEVQLFQEWLATAMTRNLPASGAHFLLLPHCTERTNATAATRQWILVFERFGLQLRIANVGCCGMAGTYGHETRNLPTSEAIFNLSWKRHLEETRPREAILATGYSCRSQSKRFGNRTVRHPTSVLLQALSDFQNGSHASAERLAGRFNRPEQESRASLPAGFTEKTSSSPG